jgi:amidase
LLHEIKRLGYQPLAQSSLKDNSMTLDQPLHYASLVDVSRQLSTGALSAVHLTQLMLDRVSAVNPSLHAYLNVTAETALAQAAEAEKEIRSGRHRGLLHGVPIAFKDLFQTAGVPTTFGSTAYAAYTATEDATTIRRMRAAGAVFLGRLHLHEGAFGEHHPSLPRCLNPWNKDYWPGGSSSGSGVAPAAGLCFGSLGTDTGGSIRFPAAANGVTGLKVTWGRTSRYGVLPLADSLDTIGPMARSAADAAVLFDAIVGYDPLDPTSLDEQSPNAFTGLDGIRGVRGLRIGVDEDYIQNQVDAETVAALHEAIGLLLDLGAVVVPVRVPDRSAAITAQIVITDVEAARFHKPVYEADKSKFGRILSGALDRGMAYGALDLAEAYITRDRFKGTLSQIFRQVDALITPVCHMAGARYEEMDHLQASLQTFLSFTAPFNVSGSPTVTLPCGFAANGLPIGMQLVGAHLSEDVILRAAHAYQQATDWHCRHPDGI